MKIVFISKHCWSRQQNNEVNCEPYTNILSLSAISAEFQRRSPQFEDTKKEIEVFSDPFSITPGSAPAAVQMELIDIQADQHLKQQYLSHDLIEFYHDFFPKETYPAVYKHAPFMVSLFGSTYLCEQFFSRMKHAKSKYRTTMTDDHLAQQLRIACSVTRPNIDRIVK
jgi:hypothetical protein